MNIRYIIPILCFLLTGCLSSYQVSDIELKARNHMDLAVEQETASNFYGALNEYFIVSEKYPATKYYKDAVLRSAVLNIHPNNPDINYAMAMDWLQIYMNLPLSPEEKKIAVLYTALIQKINQDTDEKIRLLALIDQLNKDKETLARELKQSRKKTAQAKWKLKKTTASESELANLYESELAILRDKLKKMKETELAILKDKLKKMKEIDVQMHKTKKEQQ